MRYAESPAAFGRRVLAVAALAPAACSPPRRRRPDPFPTVETWIDAPPEVPPDAPAGAPVAVGFTLWDVRNRDLFAVNGLVAKLYPAKGKAEPSVAKAIQDSPGHLLANLTVPEGGAGRIEIVTQGEQCTAGGACTTIDIPLRITGTGPPPDAPRSKLVRAQLLPVVGDVVAGRPAPIAVLLTPIGLWDPAALDLPSAIQVVITRVGGGRMGSAQLEQITPEAVPAVPGRHPGPRDRRDGADRRARRARRHDRPDRRRARARARGRGRRPAGREPG